MKYGKMFKSIIYIFLAFALIAPAIIVQAVTVTPDYSYRFYMVGNSHIDTAWRWPIQHTAEEVINDTFGRQVNALKSNSTYKFTASCSTHYKWAKEYYPDIFADIKPLVASGQWGLAGGQFVEPDLNVMEGETFVRHGLYAQHFFLEEFGRIAEVALDPDVFGLTGQFPQFIRKTGMTSYVITKLNWNTDPADGSFDPGPWNQSSNGSNSRGRESDIFWWEGIDGSDVLSYNCYIDYVGTYGTGDFRTGNNQVFNRNSRSGSFTLGSTVQVNVGGANTNVNNPYQGTFYYDYDSNIKYALGMFGNGDHGGGPNTGTGSNNHGWPANNSGTASNNNTFVLPATLDDYFKDVRIPGVGTGGNADGANRDAGIMIPGDTTSLGRVYRHTGELYFRMCRGTYTSWSRVKKDNRQLNNLSQTAEQAATLGFWTKSLENNSNEKIETSWERICINTMHDILPGSSAPIEYYQVFMNNEMCRNLLTNVQNNSLAALAHRADTSVDEGVPVFVYNPSSWQRDGETETTVTLDKRYPYIQVFDGATELPATVIENRSDGVAKISFIAKAVPSLGYKVFKVVGSETPSLLAKTVSVTENASSFVVENENLKFTISKTTGNMPSLINKKDNNREVFYSPAGFQGNALQYKLDTGGNDYPAWDMVNSEFGGVNQAFTTVNSLASGTTPEIVVNTPEKVTIKVVHAWTDGANTSQRASGNNVATRYITLLAGSDKIDVHFDLDFQSYQRNLKVAFPVSVDARGASYELAYGAMDGAKEVERIDAIVPPSSLTDPLMSNFLSGVPSYAGAVGRATIRDTRWNNSRFEHAGHKWMDITADSKSHGMSILNDAKYGYDVLKMVRNGSVATGLGTDSNISGNDTYVRTRMTVVRSPISANNDYQRANQAPNPSNHGIDIGEQNFNYSIYPHAGTWQNAKTSVKAHELNFPMQSFQVSANTGDGILGKEKSFLSLNKDNVIVGALKNQHDDQTNRNKIIVRVWETNGADTTGVVLTLPSAVKAVREVNMLEHNYNELSNDNIDNPVSKKLVAKPITSSGNTVTFDIGHYEILTMELVIDEYEGAQLQLKQQKIDLTGEFNLRGTSPDSNRRAGNLDGNGNTIPEKLWAEARTAGVDYQGIKFQLGPDAADNFVTAGGQSIALNNATGYNRVYLLGLAGKNASAVGKYTVNYTDGSSTEKVIEFADWRSPLTGWVPMDRMDTNPYVYDSIAHVFTHWHNPVQDMMTLDNYLYVYYIDIDETKTLSGIELPDAPAAKIAAITLINSEAAGFGCVYEVSDSDKPLPPTNVAASEQLDHDVLVTWTAPESDIRRYLIYVGYTPDFMLGDGVLAGTVSSVFTSFVYHPPARGNFYFRIVSVNAQNITSVPSEASNMSPGGRFNYCLPALRSDIYAEASVNNTTEHFSNACDGNDDIKWACASINQGDRSSLYIKLVDDDVPDANLPVIDSFRLLGAGKEQQSYIAMGFRIMYITTVLSGASWHTPNPSTPWADAITPVTTNTINDWSINLTTPIRARYLRLYITQGEQGTGSGRDNARIYEFAAYGMSDGSPQPTVSDGSIAAEYLQGSASVRLTANYTASTGGPFVFEADSTYEWYRMVSGVYKLLPGFGTKTVVIPNDILNAATAVKCVVTLRTTNDKTSLPTDIEYVYKRQSQTNVLLNSKLTYSTGSYVPAESADHLVNGVVVGDKWCAVNVSPSTPAVAEFELSSIFEITSFRLFHCTEGATPQFPSDYNPILNTKDFAVEYSLDGKSWTEAFHETNNQLGLSIHELAEPVFARFLRLVVYVPNNSTNPAVERTDVLRICEFEAMNLYTNVMLNSKLVDSSGAYVPQEAADHLVNGLILDDKWCDVDVSSQTPGFATFDMTGIYRISGFKLIHCEEGAVQAYDRNPVLNTRDFKVEYSLDGKCWVEAFHETNNQSAISNHNLAEPILARFVRLVVYVPTNSDGSGGIRTDVIRIREIEAFGTFEQFGVMDLINTAFKTASNANVTKLSDAAGNRLEATVLVASDYHRSEARSFMFYAAIYNHEGRLLYLSSKTEEIEPDCVKIISVDIDVPHDTMGLYYKLFIWDSVSFVPITDAYWL